MTNITQQDELLNAESMSPDEKRAALRFCETCEDGEGYNVPAEMMRKLSKLGLVRHLGGGYYQQTDKLFEMKQALEKQTESGELEAIE